jgi:5-formyltetrahydrofolate cyclo-ligase
MAPTSKQDFRDHWKRSYPRDPIFRAKVSTQICGYIQRNQEFKAASQVGIFVGRDWEIDLRILWEAEPNRCLLPRVEGEALFFHQIRSWDELKKGFAGILEPASASPLAKPWSAHDLILVPGIAFDGLGGRVGSGMGFYDRFLEHFPGKKWGVGFSEQLSKAPLAQIPTDVRMDAVVTEAGILRCSG